MATAAWRVGLRGLWRAKYKRSKVRHLRVCVVEGSGTYTKNFPAWHEGRHHQWRRCGGAVRWRARKGHNATLAQRAGTTEGLGVCNAHQ
jgi:hypothetical protein